MYIGKQPLIGNFQVCDAISTVNNQAAYTLQVGGANVSPETVNNMIVSVNGVIQKPTASYTVAGSTITFTSALVTGDVIDFIQILGSVLDLGTPSDATVTTAKIADGAVTSAKLSAGKVLQVVQGTSTTVFNTTSTTFANSSLSGVITPSSTSSKILVMASQTIQTYNASGAYGTGRWKIIKTIGTTTTDVTNVGSTSNGNLLVYDYGTSGISVTRPASLIKLDAPNTTSEITYRTQAAMGSNGGSNLQLADNLTTGTIILMEIAG